MHQQFNVAYHFKTTVMLDLQNTDFNIARESDSPAPQYQRVMHAHGFIVVPNPPKNEAELALLEQMVIEQGRKVAQRNFGLTDELVDNAVVIIDNMNIVSLGIEPGGSV